MPTFVSPDWDAPLDTEAHIRAVPPTAVIKGMYTAALVTEAKRRGFALPHAGEKYVPFLDYPLRDHLHLLVEASRAFSPDVPLRQALRRIGRATVNVFMGSTLGRASLGGLTQPETTTRAILGLARSYATSIQKPSPQSEVRETGPTSCLLKVSDFWVFLDSHQIGILEGVCRACGVRGEFQIATDGPARGEIACSWEIAPPSRPSSV